ncbi:exopolysaccharide biosynthesis polyprenyl glycosylphosphotransferase [Polaribacter haliotis]|nr:exopolysaccharide biosynthesis polyprenyl glycosylphosphotransferase [Polaribacter haliotis]
MIVDLLALFFVVYYYSNKDYLSPQFIFYTVFFWILIAYYTKFYNVYRYTHISRLLALTTSHFFIFSLAFFSYFSFFREGEIIREQFKTVLTFILIITFLKFLFFFILKKYRLSGGNYRSVIVFGSSKSAQNVVDLFSERQDLGYRFKGFFSDKLSSSNKYLGSIKAGLNYTITNTIDEIYCEVNSISPLQLKEIRSFSNENNIEVRLIPENKAIYSKDFTLEYFGTIPILKPKKLPFEKTETHIVKRIFDVIFSILVIILLLSWMLPILWILVKLDSKGSFFFKQVRDGADGKQFYCYKVRSMKINGNSDLIHATKNDHRITKIGAFLRKSSLDELPQFFNVLKGDMSVVGPRPHMNIQTKKYLKEIDNYIVRNSVKPGITGLAQVSGFRGEIEKKSDIENRVRLDIFYIENWSFILDIKIIFQTFFNIFKGQEKAY